MIRTKSALRLTVFVAESATWHSRPLHAEILRLAQAAGLAGRQRTAWHGGLRAQRRTPHLPAVLDER